MIQKKVVINLGTYFATAVIVFPLNHTPHVTLTKYITRKPVLTVHSTSIVRTLPLQASKNDAFLFLGAKQGL